MNLLKSMFVLLFFISSLTISGKDFSCRNSRDCLNYPSKPYCVNNTCQPKPGKGTNNTPLPEKDTGSLTNPNMGYLMIICPQNRICGQSCCGESEVCQTGHYQQENGSVLAYSQCCPSEQMFNPLTGKCCDTNGYNPSTCQTKVGGYSGTCPYYINACTEEQTCSNGVCCPKGQISVNGVCGCDTTCLGTIHGSVLDENCQCICPVGTIYNEETKSCCESGKKYNPTTQQCECDTSCLDHFPGSVLDDNCQCVCPADTLYNSEKNACECFLTQETCSDRIPGSSVTSDCKCSCPAGTSYNGLTGNCDCVNADQKYNPTSGKCECSLTNKTCNDRFNGSIVNSETCYCMCAPDTTYDAVSGTCKCPSGQTFDPNEFRCVTAGSQCRDKIEIETRDTFAQRGKSCGELEYLVAKIGPYSCDYQVWVDGRVDDRFVVRYLDGTYTTHERDGEYHNGEFKNQAIYFVKNRHLFTLPAGKEAYVLAHDYHVEGKVCGDTDICGWKGEMVLTNCPEGSYYDFTENKCINVCQNQPVYIATEKTFDQRGDDCTNKKHLITKVGPYSCDKQVWVNGRIDDEFFVEFSDGKTQSYQRDGEFKNGEFKNDYIYYVKNRHLLTLPAGKSATIYAKDTGKNICGWDGELVLANCLEGSVFDFEKKQCENACPDKIELSTEKSYARRGNGCAGQKYLISEMGPYSCDYQVWVDGRVDDRFLAVYADGTQKTYNPDGRKAGIEAWDVIYVNNRLLFTLKAGEKVSLYAQDTHLDVCGWDGKVVLTNCQDGVKYDFDKGICECGSNSIYDKTTNTCLTCVSERQTRSIKTESSNSGSCTYYSDKITLQPGVYRVGYNDGSMTYWSGDAKYAMPKVFFTNKGNYKQPAFEYKNDGELDQSEWRTNDFETFKSEIISRSNQDHFISKAQDMYIMMPDEPCNDNSGTITYNIDKLICEASCPSGMTFNTQTATCQCPKNTLYDEDTGTCSSCVSDKKTISIKTESSNSGSCTYYSNKFTLQPGVYRIGYNSGYMTYNKKEYKYSVPRVLLTNKADYEELGLVYTPKWYTNDFVKYQEKMHQISTIHYIHKAQDFYLMMPDKPCSDNAGTITYQIEKLNCDVSCPSGMTFNTKSATCECDEGHYDTVSQKCVQGCLDEINIQTKTSYAKRGRACGTKEYHIADIGPYSCDYQLWANGKIDDRFTVHSQDGTVTPYSPDSNYSVKNRHLLTLKAGEKISVYAHDYHGGGGCSKGDVCGWKGDMVLTNCPAGIKYDFSKKACGCPKGQTVSKDRKSCVCPSDQITYEGTCYNKINACFDGSYIKETHTKTSGNQLSALTVEFSDNTQHRTVSSSTDKATAKDEAVITLVPNMLNDEGYFRDTFTMDMTSAIGGTTPVQMSFKITPQTKISFKNNTIENVLVNGETKNYTFTTSKKEILKREQSFIEGEKNYAQATISIQKSGTSLKITFNTKAYGEEYNYALTKQVRTICTLK